MPKKRATRGNQRAKPKKPEGDIGDGLDLEQRQEKLNVFLRDFDIEVQKRLDSIEKEKVRVQSIIEKEVNLQLSHLPVEVRNMNIMDFVAAGGTVEAALLKLNGMTEDSFVEPEIVRGSHLTSKKERGVRKGKGASDRTKIVPPSSAKLPAPAKKRSRFQTPATRRLPAVWDTPAVTPKFDINLPFTPGLARAPKHGERLMSLAGSPVDVSATHKATRTLKYTRIQEEEELDGAISRVAASIPGIAKADIHRFLAEFTAAKPAN